MTPYPFVSYSWDFGDGSSGSGAIIDHTYSSDGIYTARLTVTDNAGASAWDSVQINVDPDPTRLIYVENIEMSLASVPGGTVAEAHVTIVDLDGYLRPGTVVTGTRSGPKSSTVIETTGSDGTVKLTSLKAKGTFTYTFTVTDLSAEGYTYDPSLNIETTDWISSEDLQNTPPVAEAMADPTSGMRP
jgi:PKD repeat protein